MLHLNITYHMHRNWGAASKPHMETAETCVTLAMEDHIAEDILKKGSDSVYLSTSSLGKVYLALSYISEIQGYSYSEFCTAEVVPMTEEDRVFIAKQNKASTEVALPLEDDEARLEKLLQKYRIRRFNHYRNIPLFALPQGELTDLQIEVRLVMAYKEGKFGRAVFDPHLDAKFGIAVASIDEFNFIVAHSLDDVKELSAAIDALLRMREES